MRHTPLGSLLGVKPVVSLNPANFLQFCQRYIIRVRQFLLGRGHALHLLGFAGLGICALEGGTALYFPNNLARRRGSLPNCGRHLSRSTGHHEYHY